jgi:hypothetical protein
MAAVVVAGSVLLGVVAGTSSAVFLDTTANTANSLAADTWIDFEGTLGSVTCGGSSSVVTVPAGGVPVGRTLVVRVGFRGTGGTVSVTDSGGNTYTTDLDHSANGQRSVILSAEITTALSAGDTITVTHPDENAEAVSVHRFVGLAGSGRVVETNTADGTGGSPSVSVTTGGRRLVIAAAAQQHRVGVDPGGLDRSGQQRVHQLRPFGDSQNDRCGGVQDRGRRYLDVQPDDRRRQFLGGDDRGVSGAVAAAGGD